MDRLRQTNAHLDPELIHAALERDKARKQARPAKAAQSHPNATQMRP